MSLESRLRMSESQKKRRATPETKVLMSEAHKGFRHSDESKRKMSEIAKAKGGHGPRAQTQEQRMKISEGLKLAYSEGRRK